MPSLDKMFFIEAYFENFQKKLDRLLEMNKEPFQDEALILCIVYIDWLASGQYFDGDRNNKQNFCRALKNMSGNAFFSVVHPKKLLSAAQLSGKAVISVIEPFAKAYPQKFLTQDEIAQQISASSLQKNEKSCLIENLWRASVAAICYERIRCQAIHGPGISAALSFSETEYEGKAGMRVDFHMLHSALCSIFTAVKTASLQSGEWFGTLHADE